MRSKASYRGLSMLGLVCAVLLAAPVAAAGSADVGEESHDEPVSSNRFRVGSLRVWAFHDFLPNEDGADTLGIESESYWGLGGLSFKNITYFELADYPRAIPGKPAGNPDPSLEAATGINDLLTAVWISKQGAHHGKHHVAIGAAAQFPTASDDSLGSGKTSLGPSIDYEFTSGRLFAGVIALQIWSVAGDAERKDVNMFMAKPFVVYDLTENWKAIYMPYGISVYWNKASGQKVYLPLGGGIQRDLQLGSLGLNLSAQFHKYVVRPTKGSEYDLRFMFELEF